MSGVKRWSAVLALWALYMVAALALAGGLGSAVAYADDGASGTDSSSASSSAGGKESAGGKKSAGGKGSAPEPGARQHDTDRQTTGTETDTDTDTDTEDSRTADTDQADEPAGAPDDTPATTPAEDEDSAGETADEAAEAAPSEATKSTETTKSTATTRSLRRHTGREDANQRRTPVTSTSDDAEQTYDAPRDDEVRTPKVRTLKAVPIAETPPAPGVAVQEQAESPTAKVSPAAPSVANLQKQITQRVRQVAGLASDIALLAVSVINNIAAGAAATIGRQPLWGVPYQVAGTVAEAAATVGQVLTGTPLDATSSGRFPVTYGVMNVLSFFNPTKSPAGANDPSITVTPEHPLPVVLVNGTAETQSLNWDGVGAPVLANAGYKVYSFNYGNTTSNPNFPFQSTGDIRRSAQELADEVDRVLTETGAEKVILVGHSQGGGVLPAYYINNLGGDEKVSQLIGIAPSNHGTDVMGLVGFRQVPVLGPILFRVLDLFGAAWLQQSVGSSLQDEVYGDGDTRPGVLYTTIASTHDWVVTPHTQQALEGPNVTNIVLQEQYPGYSAGHIGIAFTAQTWDAVLSALAANPEANTVPSTLLAA